MTKITYESLSVGDQLPTHQCGPITRTVLALYCGGSGDHNPIHIDSDFARKAGMPDVFAHGMLSMAYLAQLLTNWVDQRQIREFGVRFVAITPVNTKVMCRGEIVEMLELDGERCVKLELVTEIDDGTRTLIGDAIISFDEPKQS